VRSCYWTRGAFCLFVFVCFCLQRPSITGLLGASPQATRSCLRSKSWVFRSPGHDMRKTEVQLPILLWHSPLAFASPLSAGLFVPGYTWWWSLGPLCMTHASLPYCTSRSPLHALALQYTLYIAAPAAPAAPAQFGPPLHATRFGVLLHATRFGVLAGALLCQSGHTRSR
jgi:hypothetical protein